MQTCIRDPAHHRPMFTITNMIQTRIWIWIRIAIKITTCGTTDKFLSAISRPKSAKKAWILLTFSVSRHIIIDLSHPHRISTIVRRAVPVSPHPPAVRKIVPAQQVPIVTVEASALTAARNHNHANHQQQHLQVEIPSAGKEAPAHWSESWSSSSSPVSWWFNFHPIYDPSSKSTTCSPPPHPHPRNRWLITWTDQQRRVRRSTIRWHRASFPWSCRMIPWSGRQSQDHWWDSVSVNQVKKYPSS